MAQVKKFQGGGKTAEIGGYTINTNNEKDMELLRSMAATNPKYAGTVQNILDNINHSGYNNTYKMYVTADNRFVEEGAVEDVKDKHMTQRVQRATSQSLFSRISLSLIVEHVITCKIFCWQYSIKRCQRAIIVN